MVVSPDSIQSGGGSVAAYIELSFYAAGRVLQNGVWQ
jgi:hypothetical protein